MAALLMPDMGILKQINSLCAAGLRPPFIESLFPSISKRQIADTYAHYNGARPPRGPLPNSAKSTISSQALRWHATYFLIIYERMINAGVGDVNAILCAYEDYAATFQNDDPLAFDRAWIVARRFNTRMPDGIALVKCGHCGARYMQFIDELKNDRNCLIHAFDASNKRISMIQRARAAKADEADQATCSPRGRAQAYRPMQMTLS